MVSNLITTFNIDRLQYSISIPTDDNTTPFYLADLFAELIEKTNANSDIVINNLISRFNYIKSNDV